MQIQQGKMIRSTSASVALVLFFMTSGSSAANLAWFPEHSAPVSINKNTFLQVEPEGFEGFGKTEESGEKKEGEHMEHEGEHAEGEGEHMEHEHSGVIVTYGLVATITLLSGTFAMANTSNRLVRNFTWNCLDNVISIFLAVMVFQVIDEIVYDAKLIPEHHAVAGSFIYAIALLTIAVVLSHFLKSTPSNLAIFMASSSHFVSFGFMHAATLGYEHHADVLLHAFVIFVVVLAAVALIYVVAYQIKKKLGVTDDDEMMEKVDDLENDAGAMAAAMSWTILVCYVITNEFVDVEEEEEATRKQRQTMFVYAIGITVFSCMLVGGVSSLESSESYVKQRIAMFGKAMAAMCTAWAWILWGKWQFHEHAHTEAPMFSRIAFAFWMSIAAMVVIVIMAKLPGNSSAAKKDKALALLAMGLMAGWSWEETFDKGVEILAEGHPGNTCLYKVAYAGLMLAIILPVHVIYFKPIVLSLPSDDDK